MDEHKQILLPNVITFVICSGISLYTLYSLSYSWPTKGSFSWFIVIFLCPFILYNLFLIGYFLIYRTALKQKFITGLLSFIFGFLLAAGALLYSQSNALQRLIRAYEPMIQQIKQNMPTPCDKQYFEISMVKNYNAEMNRMITKNGRPIGMLLYNEKTFLLHFQGGSIDTLGSTIFYDSTTEQWQFFHNGNSADDHDLQAKIIFDQQRSRLSKCQPFN
ncbi:MAG: hypothetical protein KAG26_01990 [Methylococcales bacterium]|nr:hypothetical protein [Methylococcales bacterium]